MLLDFTHKKDFKWYRNHWLPEMEKSFIEPWQLEIIVFLKEWFSNKKQFEIQTSGTTGPPKTLLFPRESLVQSSKITNRHFKLNQLDVFLQCLPMHFVAGKMMVLRALTARGKCLALKPSGNPIKNLDVAVSFAAFTPHQLQNILDLNPEKLNLIKKAIIGGSPVNGVLEEELQPFSTRFFESYGMSETLTHIAIRPLNGNNRSPDFTVLNGFEIQIGKQNQLIINAGHLSDLPIITNDRVVLTEPDKFSWLGRLDDVINSGGIKIFPQELENKIAPLLDRPFAIGKGKDKLLGECIVLFIEGIPFNKNRLNKLLTQFKKRLIKSEIPRRIKFIDTLPQNKNNKLIRSKLND